jgi:hypothetical protein
MNQLTWLQSWFLEHCDGEWNTRTAYESKRSTPRDWLSFRELVAGKTQWSLITA